jgi:N-glycosylase/DNA lyase
MASQPDSFYRDVVKAGYRTRYFREAAKLAASGELDLEGWTVYEGPTADLVREIRRVPGCGPYVAECLCKLLGRHDGLGIDSWCRNKFQELHGPVNGAIDRAIAERYRPYGRWQGLALWLDLTREWHEKGSYGETKFDKEPAGGV